MVATLIGYLMGTSWIVIAIFGAPAIVGAGPAGTGSVVIGSIGTGSAVLVRLALVQLTLAQFTSGLANLYY